MLFILQILNLIIFKTIDDGCMTCSDSVTDWTRMLMCEYELAATSTIHMTM